MRWLSPGATPGFSSSHQLTKYRSVRCSSILQVRPDALFVQSESTEYFHIITGSASGIGLATAREGAGVVLADLAAERLPQAKARGEAGAGQEVLTSACEVSHESQVERTACSSRFVRQA